MRSGKGILRNGISAALDVNGNDFASAAFFDTRAYLLLVNIIAAPGSFFSGISEGL